jgi:hypothetical protein
LARNDEEAGVESKRDSRTRLKQRLLAALKAGAGSLVMASAVTAARPADAAIKPPERSVIERADAARSHVDAVRDGRGDPTAPTLLAWWGNWHNWGHPGWHNWPNWRNWHNLGNWHNW